MRQNQVQQVDKVPTFVNILRIWLAFVSVMAFGNTVQCFLSSTYVSERLYTLETNMSSLSARMFGAWTLLAGMIRLLCALDIFNRTLYCVTLFSFLLVLAHFTSEVFVFQTAEFTAGIIAPLVVASFSTCLMLIGWVILGQHESKRNCPDENSSILKSSTFKKNK